MRSPEKNYDKILMLHFKQLIDTVSEFILQFEKLPHVRFGIASKCLKLSEKAIVTIFLLYLITCVRLDFFIYVSQNKGLVIEACMKVQRNTGLCGIGSKATACGFSILYECCFSSWLLHF